MQNNLTLLGKKIFFASFFAFAVLGTSTAEAKSQTLEIKIEKGQMHCETCVKSVEKALRALPEIEGKSIEVSLKKSSATVTLASVDTPAKKLSEDIGKIKEALKSAGYDAEVIAK